METDPAAITSPRRPQQSQKDGRKGTFDFFFGTEHRLRKEEVEEQFNKKPRMDGAFKWTRLGSQMRMQTVNEDLKHTSGGVFVAVDSNLGAVVGAKRTSGRLNPRQGRKNGPSMGKCARRSGCLSLYRV